MSNLQDSINNFFNIFTDLLIFNEKKDVIILVIILAFILLCFLSFYLFAKKKSKKEYFDDKLIDKEISLKYNNYYLAVTPKKSCNTATDQTDECLFNIAILQANKNSNTTFKIIKSLIDNRFRLVSTNSTNIAENNKNMNKKFYVIGDENYMCFDDGGDDDIYFDLVVDSVDSNKYKIKFKSVQKTFANNVENEAIIDYYITECLRSKCDLNIRLCLTIDPTKAISFNIDQSPTGT